MTSLGKAAPVRRLIGIVLAAALATTGITALTVLAAPAAPAEAAAPAGWNAGNIIDDATFFNGSTMSVEQIQTFLNAKGPACQVAVCLKNFSQTTTNKPGTPMCAAYTGAANESAARIIFRVANSCSINPQVLLVMLQKEQGLVLSGAPSARNFTAAMGAGCPDTAACDVNYEGFFNQVHYAAYLLHRYTQPAGTGPGTAYTTRFDLRYPVGQTTAVLYSPNAGCGTQNVFIANQATHALYIYTPYTPNAASLNAGSGAVSPPDACATYGNRNFYLFYNSWFGSSKASISGTLTAESGARVGGAWVRAYTTGGDLAASSQTTAAGTYTLGALPAGRYRVAFGNDGNPALTAEWWSNKQDHTTADYITLATNQVVTATNATLDNPAFADVDQWHPFYANIEWAAATGISVGSPNPAGGKPVFSAAENVSRQAMAAFIYRLSGETYAAPAVATFVDVPVGSPFYVAVEWMASKRITVGTPVGDGTLVFKPEDPVERYVMALFLARYSGVNVDTPPTSQSFADVAPGSLGAAAVEWMAANRISVGTPQAGGLPIFQPWDKVTRQAMVAFLNRLSNLP